MPYKGLSEYFVSIWYPTRSIMRFRVDIPYRGNSIWHIEDMEYQSNTRSRIRRIAGSMHRISNTPETESDAVTESNAENLLPIPSECEVTLGDKRECDELICENSSTIDVCDNHSEILFDSNNDDLSSDDESFEDIEYVDASIPDPAIVNVEEENVVHQEEEEELLISDSILSHDSSDSNFEDIPSISRPPPEPP
nr:hypothetical protein [Tanacetum cinerariifolium]